MPRKAQAIKVAPSQQYGQGAAQIAAQKAIPLPDNSQLPAPTAPTGPTPGADAAQVAAPAPQPMPMLGAFDRPSERPGEHVSSGLPFGGGAGPEVLPSPDHSVGLQLRALYQNFPNTDLRDLIEQFDAQQGGMNG